MHSRSGILIFSVLLFLSLALLAGMGASWCLQKSLAEQQARAAITLKPLPDWAADPLPDFTGYTDVQAKKDAFFTYLFPRIALANRQILTHRKRVELLAEKAELSEADTDFLSDMAERLRIDAQIGSPELFESLDRKLDIIPPSLVLAQAANESAWGTSRFARQGNNLFGQWCFARGCGLVPLQRGDNAIHEVADFVSPYQSIRSYIANLNRHPSYKALRMQRAEQRISEQNPTGTALAEGLGAYSERGDAYIDEIISMIEYNGLQLYDERLEQWIESGAENEAFSVFSTAPGTSLARD